MSRLSQMAVSLGASLLFSFIYLLFPGIVSAILMAGALAYACYCVLRHVTPIAIQTRLENGASRGIAFKDADSLMLAARTDAVVLDKSGTLTEGKPSVVESVWDPSLALEAARVTQDLRDVLFSLEGQSDHPLAESVCASLRGCDQLPVKDFEAILGKGITGTVEGVRYYVGNLDLLETIAPAILETSSPLLVDSLRLWMDEGYQVTLLFDTRRLYAVLALADDLTDSAVQAVKVLQEHGLEVHMLTGDNEISARQTAADTGIRHFRSHVLPEEKAGYVAQLQADGKLVAMVGGSIEDDEAMAKANLAVAMGNAHPANYTALATVSSKDLGMVWQLFNLSRRTVSVIRENRFWSYFYILSAVLMAVCVVFYFIGRPFSPVFAAIGLTVCGISLISNSLRLRK